MTMKPFMDEEFLLTGNLASQLYHESAEQMPIFDYHSHLDAQVLAENSPFENLTHLLLANDHYKWRMMLTDGVEEELIRGNAPDWDKFLAYARVLQGAIGNPLYHWTHLELQRVFGIKEPLSEQTAKSIWDECNEKLKSPEYRPQALLERFQVRTIYTAEGPLSVLKAHQQLINQPPVKLRVRPAFSPDAAIQIDQPGFSAFVGQLSELTGKPIRGLGDLVDALENRIDYFHAVGCRSADHRLPDIPAFRLDEEKADRALKNVLSGQPIKRKQADIYRSALLVKLGLLYARRNWVQQYHIGSLQNTNQRMYALYGADVGFDSVSDAPIAENLSKLLDAQERMMSLPKTILYCINPAHSYVVGSMIGNFQQSNTQSKLQMGPPWRFHHQRDGIQSHLRLLANLSLLNRSIGMTADSRSFVSFSRHEYFRRILCEVIGVWVTYGEFPNDISTLLGIVRDICYHNAVRYFE